MDTDEACLFEVVKLQGKDPCAYTIAKLSPSTRGRKDSLGNRFDRCHPGTSSSLVASLTWPRRRPGQIVGHRTPPGRARRSPGRHPGQVYTKWRTPLQVFWILGTLNPSGGPHFQQWTLSPRRGGRCRVTRYILMAETAIKTFFFQIILSVPGSRVLSPACVLLLGD